MYERALCTTCHPGPPLPPPPLSVAAQQPHLLLLPPPPHTRPPLHAPHLPPSTGPYKGGLRFRPGVNLSIIKFLVS